MYYWKFLKFLNLRVLALPSRWALTIGAWLVLMEISKSSEFVGVGSAVKVGFHYRGLACITRDYLKVLNLRALALSSRLALIIRVWLVLRRIF